MTYCHTNNDTVIYLCHVPQLRKFDSEAKGSLNQYAWLLAKNTISEEIKEFKGNVIVGLRGVIIYDKFMFGNMTNEMVQEYSSDEGKKMIETILVKKIVNAQQGAVPEPATVDGSATQSSISPASGSATQSSIPPAPGSETQSSIPPTR
ncbi:hypothetical protein LBMAG53_00020 [Planctomycetota bacterium]|nr:hypothetical protein LBMAG53_00020 [Planctomycetota bacterium]